MSIVMFKFPVLFFYDFTWKLNFQYYIIRRISFRKVVRRLAASLSSIIIKSILNSLHHEFKQSTVFLARPTFPLPPYLQKCLARDLGLEARIRAVTIINQLFFSYVFLLHFLISSFFPWDTNSLKVLLTYLCILFDNDSNGFLDDVKEVFLRAVNF